MTELVAELKALLGADRVLDQEEARAGRALDTWPLGLLRRNLGERPAPPRCLILPRSTDEVARALAHLYGRGIPVVPYGGGSGVAGGAAAVPGGVTIDMRRMDRVLDVDTENMMLTAEAGLALGRLESVLGERGLTTGHYPQSIDLAQLGGLVATRSAGQFSTRYGSIEDLLLGLEAVLPDGQVVRTRAVPRRSAGPDLRHLWLGSEGAFGIITEVTLRLFPTPAARWMQAYGVASMRAGLAAIARCLRAGWRPAVVRLQDEAEALRHYADVVAANEAILLILSEGPPGYAELEGAAVDALLRGAGARPLGAGPVQTWLERRNDVHEFEKYINLGMVIDTIEVAAGWSAVADIYEQTVARLRAAVPELAVVFAHSSHSYAQGTNLYFIFAAAPQASPMEAERVYRAVWERVIAVTLENGGTICHHHGIGRWRAPWLPSELGTSYELLQRLKRALDPKGIMNPGTLLTSGR